MELYLDRKEAGKILSQHIQKHVHIEAGAVVLGLPRGGMPVAEEVAKKLNLPLDILLVRKIGSPINKELAIGAVAEGDVTFLNRKLMKTLGVTIAEANQIAEGERRELARRLQLYRQGQAARDVRGREVILVDDGLATGATLHVAIQYLKQKGAKKIIVAVPVGPLDSIVKLKDQVDQVICPMQPTRFMASGHWYDNFAQVTDDEVLNILKRGGVVGGVGGAGGLVPSVRDVQIPISVRHHLLGSIRLPVGARGIVVFVHGSGSSRLSPRNQMVAEHLAGAGYASLLFDLLTEDEAQDRSKVFDVPLLAERLEKAIEWINGQSNLSRLPIFLFGASTGGGAALWVAANSKFSIKGVISRGGRPDLAQERLGLVKCPVLLIVGDLDHSVLMLNQEAKRVLAQAELKTVAGATHLFEEKGALERVCNIIENWLNGVLVKEARALGGQSRSGEPGPMVDF